ncbi:MAG: hypothetical protein OEZ58_03115 [Gammaproteobacteria bacterium]|nr:hypothetical protein [Gammaproteobacteria bacterium]MDH5727953.1 hypothetical protein [Gammaproteobacteria bacterium]
MKFIRTLFYKNWESNRKDELKRYENLSDFNLTLVDDKFGISELSTRVNAAPTFYFDDRGIALTTIEEDGKIVANKIMLGFSVIFSHKSNSYELKCSSEIVDSTTETDAYLDLYSYNRYPQDHPALIKLNQIGNWVLNRIFTSLIKKFGNSGNIFELLGKDKCYELVAYLKFIAEHRSVAI